MRLPTHSAKRRHRDGPLVAMVVVAAFAAACSTSSGPALSTSAATATGPAAPTSATGNGAVPKDLCGLLTPAEIGPAVGYSVASGKLNASGNACLWQGQTAIGVQLVVGTGGESAFKTMAAFPMTGGSQPISGIGDEAAQSTGTEAVVFRKGEIVVTVDASDATTGAAAILAKLVASRL